MDKEGSVPAAAVGKVTTSSPPTTPDAKIERHLFTLHVTRGGMVCGMAFGDLGGQHQQQDAACAMHLKWLEQMIVGLL